MRAVLIAAMLAAAGTVRAARPVVRWDVVPCQRVASRFCVGVVAFHEDPLRVAFAVNGRIRHIVDSPSLNQRTGVREYCYDFDPAKFPEGAVTIVACVKTSAGESQRVSTALYSDPSRALGSRRVVYVDSVAGNDFADGSAEEPVKSLKEAVLKAGDGGTVRLAPGRYSAKAIGGGLSRRFWTCIEPADGVDRSAVTIYGGRTGTDKLLFRNVEFRPVPGQPSIIIGEEGRTMAWFDNCRFAGEDGSVTAGPFGRGLRAFVTGGLTDGLGRGLSAELVRGHVASGLAGHVFSGGNSLVVNCAVDGIESADSSVLPDIFHVFENDAAAENVVVFGLRAARCKARAFSLRNVRDVAVVDVQFDSSLAPATVETQFSGPCENVYLRNIDTGSQTWRWTSGSMEKANFRPKDVRLHGVRCGGFSGFDTVDGSLGLTIDAGK